MKLPVVYARTICEAIHTVCLHVVVPNCFVWEYTHIIIYIIMPTLPPIMQDLPSLFML